MVHPASLSQFSISLPCPQNRWQWGAGGSKCLRDVHVGEQGKELQSVLPVSSQYMSLWFSLVNPIPGLDLLAF
ncbi:hypothetical protein PM082_017954 [Marasmius tenuissimus]|nr:hypothetical protein PM082_017954 [Marasmius tenuissimus]